MSSTNIRRKGYHHGNLREALVLAAKQLILEKGPHGFTLVEAAKIAGVSPGAPYRHFKDQQGLLGEVALQGFLLFGKRLNKAWNQGEPSWLEAFVRVGHAYMDFAFHEQAFYRAMFEADLSGAASDDLAVAGEKAFDQLIDVARHIKAHSIGSDDLTEREIAFHISSMSHGAAMMLRRVQNETLAVNPTELLLRNIDIYLKGLGISV